MHTDVLMQRDLDLGLTLHHHAGQPDRHLTLSVALSETTKQGLEERKPEGRGGGKQGTKKRNEFRFQAQLPFSSCLDLQISTFGELNDELLLSQQLSMFPLFS